MESGQKVEVETEGLITEISRDRCVVSIEIDGTTNSLSFGKRFLYTFGQQCDGDMTNILEEEMEVNVCFKYSLNQLSVVAVWVGDKPDLSNRDVKLLDDVFNQTGIVHSIYDDGSFVVRSDALGFNVVVRLDVMFRDGCLLESELCPVTIGDEVTFDAVPNAGEPSEATYRATCAWFGREPRLTDRFKLSISSSSEQDLEVLTKDCVYGNVIVIPNDSVAFVCVEDCCEKVLLFRSSFHESRHRIGDIVKVGDVICMRLSFCCIFPGCKLWFAAAACMDGEDISKVNRQAVTQMRESISSGAQGSDVFLDISADDSEVYESASESNDSNESSGDLPSEEVANAKSLLSDVGDSETYKGSSSLLYNKTPLTGILCANTRVSGIIRYGEFKILINKDNFFYEGKVCSKKEFKLKQNILVNFEAYPRPQLSKNVHGTHEAVCAWIGAKPTLSCVASNLNKGKNFLPEDNTIEGRVIGFYLPEVAFLTTGNIDKKNKSLVFCLHLTDLGKPQAEVFSEKPRNIYDFVKVGDYVKCKVRKNKKFPLGICAYGIEKSNKTDYKTFLRTQRSDLKSKVKTAKKSKFKTAEVDWDEVHGTTNTFHTIPEYIVNNDEDPHFVSWESIWACGEYFKTGEVVMENGKCVVKFVSFKQSNTVVTLDLSTAIKTKRLYCDGKPLVVSLTSKRNRGGKELKPSTAESTLVGREISCHVGRKYLGLKDNDAVEIKCAWIGEFPEIPTLLGKVTAAFKNLICQKWYYEGIIAGFPLPTHAICKVGSLQVHLPLTPIKKNGEMIGVVQSHLKVGDTVMLKIMKEYYETTKISCLTSSFYPSIKQLYDDQDVLKVVQGTIVELPNPVGKIKMLDSSIEAQFDRSSVLAVNGVGRFTRIIYAWAHLIDKSLDVGTVVFFSAAIDLTLNSYRAYEVWIGKSPKK